VTYNSGAMYIYVNGVLATGVAAGMTNPVNTSTQRFIGKSDNSALGSYKYFDGLIDEPRIYNRALSSTEINLLYRSNLSSTKDYREYRVNYT